MSLRPGVRSSEVVEYSVIDFVYSTKAFAFDFEGLAAHVCRVGESQLGPPVRQLRLLSGETKVSQPNL